MSNRLADIASGKKTAPAPNNLSLALDMVKQQKMEQAVPYLEASLADNETVQAHMLLAEHHIFKGHKDLAEKHYKRAYEMAPSAPEILFHMLEFGFHKVANEDDPLLQTLLQLENHIQKFLPENRAQIYYSLAKAYRTLGDYDRDFSYVEKGAKEKQTIAPFNPEAHGPYFEAIASYFSPEFYEQHKNEGIESERPVFVAGMPRSGTTLVEQILHSHKDVFGVGEDTSWMQLLTQKSYLPPLPETEEIVYPYRLEPEEDEAVLSPAEIAAAYDNYLQKQAPDAKRVVNKAISSYIWLGMAPVCFPNIKIIFCHRNPLDTCISAYFHNFVENRQAYTNDLEILGDYYRCAYDLMAHWSGVMPDNVLNICYEDLLEDQEGQSRKMIEFLGLDWDPACLTFYETEKTVKTASTQQVRAPLNKDSAGRWKNYKKHLGPLKKALGKYADN